MSMPSIVPAPDEGNKAANVPGKEGVVDEAYRVLTRWALVGLILDFAAVVLLDYLSGKDFSKSARPYLGSLKDLLIHFIPLFVIAVFVSPLLKALEQARSQISSQTTAGNLKQAVASEIQSLRLEIRTIARRGIPLSITDVYATYQDVPWSELLARATEVDLAVLYCSSDWLGANESLFTDFLKRKGVVRLYLPPLTQFETKAYESVNLRPETTQKILRTLRIFREAARSVSSSTLSVFALKQGISYVVARFKSSDGKRIFVFSPLRNNQESVAVQPPAIVLDEALLDQSLRALVDDDDEYLRAAEPYPDFEAEHYLTWEKSKERVFVSVALSCPLSCDFCYIESIVPNPIEQPRDNFGRVLAFSILGDSRFNRGPRGTRILIGGFTEPFVGQNSSVTIQLMNTLGDNCGNFVHVATRSSRVSELISKLRFPERAVINYSISSLSGDISGGGKEEVTKRLADATKVLAAGGNVGLYVRPVVPGRTLKDSEEIATLAWNAGIRHVTVGGLYVDARVQRNLEQGGVVFNGLRTTSKTLILDAQGSFKKMPDDEVRQVQKRFRDRRFRVFSSSTELLLHFIDGRCDGACRPTSRVG